MATVRSREERRIEAVERSKHYVWEDSKAKRLETATKEEWTERNKLIANPAT